MSDRFTSFHIVKIKSVINYAAQNRERVETIALYETKTIYTDKYIQETVISVFFVTARESRLTRITTWHKTKSE